MVFSSIEFLWFFMPVVLALYALVPPGGRNLLLAVVSVVFYAWGAHAVVFVFLASIALNYLAGRLIGRFKGRGRGDLARRVMWAAVVANLLVLFGWKYTVFAVEQLNGLVGVLGGDGEAVGVPSILLPIGISFFTFHGISYVVDVARESAPPMRKLGDFAQYMAFFPQLIAGPIVRYHQIDDQIRHPPPRSQRLEDLAEGFPRFALGLCKKVLVADQVAPVADAAFADPSGLTFTGAWIGALAYTVQIYFDFSGYSDMAIGLARMFGFRFPENFDRPYSAVSMTDFWRRWHITLSRWFRDYVYIPLGGSRVSQQVTVRNLMVIFLLVGAWHGAAWTFVLWGLYNGSLLVAERLTGIAGMSDDRLAVTRRAGTFVLVVAGWVLFRATSLGDAADVYAAMLTPSGGALPAALDDALLTPAVLALAFGLASVLLPRDLVMGRILQGRWTGAPLAARFAVLCLLPFAAITVAAGSFSPFLYFQF
jgi:alginate O-acetyltransferase complex protein AlgI